MTTNERLYNLLPAVYRQRDRAVGEPLRALMATLERELDKVRTDVETTYENWFIETCEEWLVPHLATALGISGMQDIEAVGWSQRGYAGNAIRRRRRKGTAAVVEQLALDTTGLRARAVEFFALTATTLHMQHTRGASGQGFRGGTIDVRSSLEMEQFGTAFDPHAHSPDVRRLARGRGLYNFPNLGLYLWRIQSYEASRSTARAVAGESNWYRVDPHGRDVPLYNLPKTEVDIASLATEENVAHPLSRLALHAEIEGRVPARYLGTDPSIVVRTVSDTTERSFTIEIANLSDAGGVLPSCRPAAGNVLVDPELGRLVFNDADVPPTATTPFEVLVDYNYGSPSIVGATVADRAAAHAEQLSEDTITFQRYVTRNQTLAAELGALATLEAAVSAWNTHATATGPGAVGRIVLLGGRSDPSSTTIAPESRTYDAPFSTIALPAGTRLHIVSGNLNRTSDGSGGFDEDVTFARVRSTIIGDFGVRGEPSTSAQARPGGLFLNGLSIEGQLTVEAGDMEQLDLSHCQVLPGHGGILVQGTPGSNNSALSIRLSYSVCHGVDAANGISRCQIHDSITADAVTLPGADLEVLNSTLLGTVAARTLSAQNSIFDETITTEHQQQGCMRFCYVPPGSVTPRKFRCQPDLASFGLGDPDAIARVRASIKPTYVSNDPALPGYCLLHPSVPAEISQGADNGSEMGVFHHLQFALRLSNLTTALRQYSRFGLEAGLLFGS